MPELPYLRLLSYQTSLPLLARPPSSSRTTAAAATEANKQPADRRNEGVWSAWWNPHQDTAVGLRLLLLNSSLFIGFAFLESGTIKHEEYNWTKKPQKKEIQKTGWKKTIINCCVEVVHRASASPPTPFKF
jgi:hypothetical protein